LFNWEGNGFKIVAEANNGEAAILKLKNDQPDLIITDIKMPIKNGIELIQYVKHHYPSIKCVALSNYNDFELTRPAFIEGAVDYLLKSDLNNENFTALAQRLKIIFFPQGDDIKESNTSDISFPNYSLDKAHLIQDLIQRGSLSAGQTDFLDEGMPYVICTVVPQFNYHKSQVSEVKDFNFSITKNTILKIISEILELKSYYYCENINKFILLIYNDEKEESVFIEKLDVFLHSLCSNIQIYLNVPTTIGVSELEKDVSKLVLMYSLADALAKNSFYDETASIYYHSKTPVYSDHFRHFVNENLKQIPKYINEKNWSYIISLFQSLCKLAENHKYPPQKFKRLVINLMFLMQGEMVLHYFNDKDLFQENEQDNELIDQILQSNKMSQVEDYISQYIARFKERSNYMEIYFNHYSTIINQTLQYLHQNFQIPSTNLTTVAKAISVNQSYLSRLFFKEINTHFNAYLTDLRLRASKNLLVTTNDSIHTISEYCGYSNPKYYINLFKKVEGITPNSYRNQTREYYADHLGI
jgi:two-component system response regulator YesN